MSRTKFSFEVPIAHLKDFDDLQDFYFALSYLFENGQYAHFMRIKAHEGLKPVWLDNSYNEKLKADSEEDMIRLAVELGATKVISPDDPHWTTKQILNRFHSLSYYLPTSKIIVVVNSKEMLLEASRHGASYFAYSYWVRQERTIEENFWGKHLHFLGMLTPEELRVLDPPSCDTGLPIKMALKGWSWKDWADQGMPHIYTHSEFPDYYNMRLTNRQINRAKLNIKTLKDVMLK